MYDRPTQDLVKAVRNLTDEIKILRKVNEALNNTLVAIEKRRREEAADVAMTCDNLECSTWGLHKHGEACGKYCTICAQMKPKAPCRDSTCVTYCGGTEHSHGAACGKDCNSCARIRLHQATKLPENLTADNIPLASAMAAAGRDQITMLGICTRCFVHDCRPGIPEESFLKKDNCACCASNHNSRSKV